MTASLNLTQPDPRQIEASFARLRSRSQLADGQPPFNDQALVDARTGARTLVVATLDGSQADDPIAAAIIVGQGEFELVIDPEFRRNGLGSKLLERVLDDAEPGISAWAHGDHPASRVLASRTGFVPVRTLLQLQLALSPDDAGDETVGIDEARFTIDAFTPGTDDEAWVALNARIFASFADQGSMTIDDLHERMREPWFDAADFLVARRDGELIGYNWLKIQPDEPGEIYVLGVDPASGGLGLGSSLMRRGLDRLRQRGCSTAALYVDAENERAVNLYRSLGFTDHTVDVQYRRPDLG